MLRLQQVSNALSPAWRGALFYLGYWGGTGVFVPFINVYFVDLGFTGRQIGMLAALFPLMTLVAAPILSALGDSRSQRITILSIVLGGLAVTLMVLSIPKTFILILPLMALLGFFRSAISPVADSVIVRMAIRHRLNFGNLRLWGSVSFAILAVGCGFLWDQMGFGLMFALAGLLFVPVVFLALLLEEEPTVARQNRQPVTKLRHDLALVAILMATLATQAGLEMSFLFGGIFMDTLGGSRLLVGMLFAVAALSELPTMQYADAIIRWLRGPNTLLLAYFLCGMGLLGFALASTPWSLLMASVIRGLGFGLFFISTVRLIDERVPRELSSTVQGIMSASAFGLSPLLASLLAGEIYDRLGVQAVFAGGVLLTGLAMLIIILAAANKVFEQTALAETDAAGLK